MAKPWIGREGCHPIRPAEVDEPAADGERRGKVGWDSDICRLRVPGVRRGLVRLRSLASRG